MLATISIRKNRKSRLTGVINGPEFGRKGLAEIAAAARVPVSSINATRAAEVLAAGPAGIAVMGGIMRAADPPQEIKALLATVTSTRR